MVFAAKVTDAGPECFAKVTDAGPECFQQIVFAESEEPTEEEMRMRAAEELAQMKAEEIAWMEAAEEEAARAKAARAEMTGDERKAELKVEANRKAAKRRQRG